MASLLNKKGNQMKTVKWQDLVNLKKKIPVDYTDEEGTRTLFYLQELGAEDFAKFWDMLVAQHSNNDKTENEKENKIFNTINNNTSIAFLLRRMCIGVDFGDMDDDQLVKYYNNFSDEITSSINKTFEDLVFSKINTRIENLNKIYAKIMESGVDLNAGKQESEITEQQSEETEGTEG